MTSWREAYDVIVVGAGSAGCALASRLSEQEGRRVLLLEAGTDYATLDDFPTGITLATSMSAWVPGHPKNWNFTGALSPEQPEYPIARGKIIGGSTAINGTIFLRGRPLDFDTWAARGQDLWSYEQVLPFFRKTERDLDFGGEFHGDAGPIPVSRPMDEDVRPVAEAFHEACLAAGFPDEPDKNVPGAEGVGPIPRNVHRGLRINAALAHLTPAVRARENLTVLGDTHVRRVLFDGARAVGVEAERGGELVTFRADETILSASGIKSPHLLLLSGIGPADALRGHGIAVVHDSPGVGRNVKDHPTVFPIALVEGEEPLPDGILLAHTALHHTAPGSDEESDLEISWGRVQGMLSLNAPLNVSKSSGEIFLRSGDPDEAPGINLNYLSHPEDLPRLADNVRIMLDLLASPAFRDRRLTMVAPEPVDSSSDAALEQWIRANLASCMHTHNSTAMGSASDPDAVVDQRCRVHGVDGLRVADVGIIPFIRTGPAATAAMIGERVAALVDEDLGA